MRALIRLLLVSVGVVLAATTVRAGDLDDAQEIVDKAQVTIGNFAADPDMGWFRDNLDGAKGLLIVPTMIKGGFIIGGSGGSGALLARADDGKAWSYPAFYTLGSVTFGLQLGGEVSEIILMVMTKRGMDALLSDSFKLGADVSVAAGPTGAGAKAQIADIIAFSRTKGVYGGLNVEGAVIATRDKWNSAYYGGSVRPLEILVTDKAHNPKADPLRGAVAQAATAN